MSRTNPIGLLLGIFFTGWLAVLWLWAYGAGGPLGLWATWAMLVFGAASGFYIWLHGLKCARLVRDVPLSKIATVAQGYAELRGEAVQFEDQHAKSVADLPVLWYRREVATRAGGRSRNAFPFNLFYTTTQVEESQTPFAIKDETGSACILPDGAEIICARKSTDYDGNLRVTEAQIVPGDPLYVVGEFSSETPDFNFEDEYHALADAWRNDPRERARFDRDRDGKLDSQELMALESAAAAAVAERETQVAGGRQTNVLHQPDDGREFLISTLTPRELAGNYVLWLSVGFAMFLGCTAAAATMVVHHVLL